MIKTPTEIHPLTYRLLRLIKSNIEEPLEPEEPLIRMDEIIFE